MRHWVSGVWYLPKRSGLAFPSHGLPLLPHQLSPLFKLFHLRLETFYGVTLARSGCHPVLHPTLAVLFNIEAEANHRIYAAMFDRVV